MKTREITRGNLKEGMTIFFKSENWMSTVVDVKDDGFKFFVLNGLWEGTVSNDEVHIHETGQRRRIKDDFVEVLAVTRDEFDRWYMGNGSSRHRMPIIDEATGKVTGVERGDIGHEEFMMDSHGGDYVSDHDEEVDEDGSDRPKVYETQITVTIYGEADSAQAFENGIRDMSLSEIEREMNQGDLVGNVQIASTHGIPDENLKEKLEAIGSDESFFRSLDDEDDLQPD